jgi:hypothetical protein
VGSEYREQLVRSTRAGAPHLARLIGGTPSSATGQEREQDDGLKDTTSSALLL